jgi:uncharacterized protein YbbK (DUF523 family)
MKILVSSCLLGEDVKYDGGNNSVALNPKVSFSLKELFMDILCENEIYSFCPEVSGGLKTPRTPAEIVKRDKPFIVQTQNGEDVTINFLLGAKKALDLCMEEGIKVALLKANSPSCGNIKTYDGTFSNTLIESDGLSAKLLKENGVMVFNEEELKELSKFIKTNK